MNFKLVLVPVRPNEFILRAEKPLSGLAFIVEASKCLRRNLDTVTRCRHDTLGTLAKYEISVPQAIAIDSGRFEDSDTYFLPVEDNILSEYLFHGASFSNVAKSRSCYPYYENEIVLASYVDELAFLNTWKSRGYPTAMGVHASGVIGNVDVIPGTEYVDPKTYEEGDLVLDDVTNDDINSLLDGNSTFGHTQEPQYIG